MICSSRTSSLLVRALPALPTLASGLRPCGGGSIRTRWGIPTGGCILPVGSALLRAFALWTTWLRRGLRWDGRLRMSRLGTAYDG